MRPAVTQAIRHFLKTTTLHGFKYLNSPFYFDRVCWVLWCVMGAVCAGLLCAVLWERFLQLPALLALTDDVTVSRAPLVAVCLTPERVAQILAQRLSLAPDQAVFVPLVITKILRRNNLPLEHVLFLKNLLKAHNLTLTRALMDTTPECDQLIKKCRYRDEVVPCKSLFTKTMNQWGACCLAHSEKFDTDFGSRLVSLEPDLDLIMECSNGIVLNGCEMKCKELKCGCSDPLRSVRTYESGRQPPCDLQQLNCLRSFKLIDESCNCPPTCNKISTVLSLEAGRLTQVANTFDSFFMRMNATTMTAFTLRIRNLSSKVFYLQYTETWWSLLSSLGGVFNMFLGVGLFSALDIIFLVLSRLPVAIRQSTEIQTHPIR